MQQRILVLGSVFLAFLALVVTGCSSNHASSLSRKGHLTLTFQWPKRGRLIPDAAQSLQINLSAYGEYYATKSADRPESVGQNFTTTFEFWAIPEGQVYINASAYSGYGATGTVLAIGSTSFTIGPGQSMSKSLTLDSTIDHLTLTPSSLALLPAQTDQLTVTAFDSSNAVILLTPSKLQWSSLDTGVATIDSTGLVTAVAAGSTTVRVKDIESDKIASASVSVSNGGGEPITFVADQDTAWVAFQDGNGPWQVLGTTPGTYTPTVTDPSGHYGIAQVTAPAAGTPSVHVMLASRTSLPTSGESAITPSRYSVSGNTIGTGSFAIVSMGTVQGFAPVPSLYSLSNVPGGLRDLCALETGGASPMLYIERDVPVTGNITGHNIDFTGVNAAALTTTNSVSGTFGSALINLVTKNGTEVMLGNGTGAVNYDTVPTGSLIAGDLYRATITGQLSATSTFVNYRYFAAAQDIAVTPPPAFNSSPVATQTSGGNLLPSYAWSSYSGTLFYLLGWSITGLDGAVIVLPERAADLGNTYVFPDFSGLANWNPAWSIPSSASLTDSYTGLYSANTSLDVALGVYQGVGGQAADGSQLTMIINSNGVAMVRGTRTRRGTPTLTLAPFF